MKEEKLPACLRILAGFFGNGGILGSGMRPWCQLHHMFVKQAAGADGRKGAQCAGRLIVRIKQKLRFFREQGERLGEKGRKKPLPAKARLCKGCAFVSPFAGPGKGGGREKAAVPVGKEEI